MLYRVGLALAVLCALNGSAAAQNKPAGYAESEYLFNNKLDLNLRMSLQAALIAAGYLNGVPNESFNQRIFNAILRLQTENGLAATGRIDSEFVDRLFQIATPMYRVWQFKLVSHPIRGHSIWMPTGMGLQPRPNQHGLSFTEPNGLLQVNFNHFPDLKVEQGYADLIAKYSRTSVRINYKTMKDGWFVLSTTSETGTDGYIRYHNDGTGMTGFAIFWRNDRGNVSGERIAVLMSASLWSRMTGSPFVGPPNMDQPKVAANRPVQPVREPAEPPLQVVPTPSVTPAPTKVSSGTGFFVHQDGSFVTNAHVVKECNAIQVRTDNRDVASARVIRTDVANDLALLQVARKPKSVARLRSSARLGEEVAAFGFPHTDLLATSGNFTVGHITATSGMGDDSRFYQVSAPVQSGNSGGPLLDQRGNVVGVVTSKLNALKVAMRDGDLPQNVNFAVKSSLLTSFLEANNVAFERLRDDSDRLASADLAEIGQKISGLVTCQH